MKRNKIAFQKLVNQHSCYPLSVRCDTFQWMIKTGWGFQNERGRGVFDLLWGLPGPNNQSYNQKHGIKSVHNIDFFLSRAFVRAIVAKDVFDHVLAWRDRERIDLDRYRMILLPEARISYRSIHQLFEYEDKVLTTQLNPYHADAVHIRHISLSPNRDGWVAILNYGVDYSGWNYRLVNERVGFADAVVAAITRMKELTAKPPANFASTPTKTATANIWSDA